MRTRRAARHEVIPVSPGAQSRSPVADGKFDLPALIMSRLVKVRIEPGAAAIRRHCHAAAHRASDAPRLRARRRRFVRVHGGRRGCQDVIDGFLGRHIGLNDQLPWLAVVPALVGMLFGAPLLGREFEHGTWRLVWTQRVARRPLAHRPLRRARRHADRRLHRNLRPVASATGRHPGPVRPRCLRPGRPLVRCLRAVPARRPRRSAPTN